MYTLCTGCDTYRAVSVLESDPNMMHQACVKEFWGFSPFFSFGKKRPKSAVHRLFIRYQVRFVILHQKQSVQ